VKLLIAGSVVAPVRSLQVAQPPTLYVTTPCYARHIRAWSDFLASVFNANETSDGAQCGFGKTIWTTVVTDEQERKLFEEELSKSKPLRSTGNPRIDLIHIKTLEEVMRSTKAVDPVGFPKLLPMLTNPSNGHRFKHAIQASKKFYGCLDAAGVQVNGSEAKAGDVCLLVDSESIMLRNSFCHLATAYMQKKTVFMSPQPSESKEVGRVRGALGLHDADDEQVGAFYAMESYHWFFEIHHLQHFVQQVSIPRLLLDGLFHEADLFFEELYYHYLYPQREAFGYKYVNALDMMEHVVGAGNYHKILNSEPVGKQPLEMLTAKMNNVPVDTGRAIGRALRTNGVLMMRCQQYDLDQVQALMESLDLCCSAYCRGQIC
jgi:hypothetical protein